MAIDSAREYLRTSSVSPVLQMAGSGEAKMEQPVNPQLTSAEDGWLSTGLVLDQYPDVSTCTLMYPDVPYRQPGRTLTVPF